MSFALARWLLQADAVSPKALGEALLFATTRGTSLVRALLATRAVDPARLEQELARTEAPSMQHVAPVPELVAQLPPGLCDRLLALPVRHDALTGTVDVAVVDARDLHAVEEVAFWLAAPVRLIRISLASMEAALARLPEPSPRPPPVPPRPEPRAPPAIDRRTPAYGSPTLPLHGAAPFPLTRKTIPPVPIIAIGGPAPAASPPPEPEPVIELRTPKSSRPPSVSIEQTLEAMRATSDRDAILDLVVAGVRAVARKVAVFAVRRETLVGWTCSPELGDRAALRAIRLAPGMSRVLTEALGSPMAILARLPKDAVHAPLAAAMRVPPMSELAFVAVRLAGKPVALVVADEMGSTMAATKRMEDVADAAGDALASMLRGRRG